MRLHATQAREDARKRVPGTARVSRAGVGVPPTRTSDVRPARRRASLLGGARASCPTLFALQIWAIGNATRAGLRWDYRKTRQRLGVRAVLCRFRMPDKPSQRYLKFQKISRQGRDDKRQDALKNKEIPLFFFLGVLGVLGASSFRFLPPGKFRRKGDASVPKAAEDCPHSKTLARSSELPTQSRILFVPESPDQCEPILESSVK